MAKQPERKARFQGIPAEIQFVDADAPPTPESEPIFVNNVRFSRIGADVFLDVGVVPVDDIIKLHAGGKGPPRILVTQRLAMSVNTFATLYQLAGEILGKMKDEDLLHEIFREKTAPKNRKKRNAARSENETKPRSPGT